MEVKEINYSKEYIENAISLRNKASKEDVLRYNFVSYLKLMFPPETKWIRDHIDGSEFSLGLKRRGKTVIGFVDSCLDSIAIEYEKDLRIQAIYDEGYRQVKEYCAALVREGIDISLITGVLSDTVSWQVFAVEETEGLPISDYTQENIKLKEVDSLELTTATEQEAKTLIHFLSRHLGKVGSRFVSGKNLSNDFGINSQYSTKYLDKFAEYVKTCREKKPEYYSMVQRLWTNFIEYTDTTSSSDESFISEYYISTLGKLLCANFIESKALQSEDIELKQIIDGSFFENRGYFNFVEYDYFGWLNNDCLIEKLLPTLRLIQNELIVYDFTSEPKEDLFGDIMVQMAHRAQRILLGQELTPQWLSKAIVAKVSSIIPKGEHPCFLDMCCGSGSMLIETLRFVLESLPKESHSNDVQKLISSAATGFDIDPLAIILAKINWILTVKNVKNEYGIDKVFIPIYHADSLFINTPVTKGTISRSEVQRMQLHDCSVDLPSFLIEQENQALFDDIIDACYDSLGSKDFNPDIIETRCDRIINSSSCQISDDQCVNIIRFAIDLSEKLHDLNNRGQNGLWSFLIKNSFRPNLIGARFNGIVSNTPWLSMSKISSNPYKDELETIAKYYNIKPAGSSFLHLEMATIFLVHAVDKFLKEDAAFGCIIPETVLSGKHHEPFRMRNFRRDNESLRMNIDEIWSLPISTFKNRAIAIFGHKSETNVDDSINGKFFHTPEDIEERNYNVLTGHNRLIWSQSQVNAKHGIYDSYSFEQGADILPRYLTIFNLREIGGSYEVTSLDRTGAYGYFIPDMHEGKDYKLPKSKASKELFFPLIVSKIISPFHIGDYAKAFLPIKRENGKIRKLSENEILALDRTDQNLISTVQNEYYRLKQQDIFTRSLNYRNKLSRQVFSKDGYLVVYCAGGSNVCGAYINLEEIDEFPIIDQTVYWCEVKSEDEALFMTGLLNCETLNNSISAFQPQGAFGERHIHTLAATSLPAFNSYDTSHMEVVNKTRTLIDEMKQELIKDPDLTNPLKSEMKRRRKRFREIIKSLNIYESYLEACNQVL